MLEPNYAVLEQNFKDCIGNLPNYKRSLIFEYVNALKWKIELLDKEINELADMIIKRDEKYDPTDVIEREAD